MAGQHGMTDAGTVWTPRLKAMRAAVQSPQFGLLILSRLLELALNDDGRTAIEALKLLSNRASDSQTDLDPELMALDVEELEAVMSRAANYILSEAGGESGASQGLAGVGAEVLSVLRFTDYAELPAGVSPSPDHGGVATGGSGDYQASADFDAAETREE